MRRAVALALSLCFSTMSVAAQSTNETRPVMELYVSRDAPLVEVSEYRLDTTAFERDVFPERPWREARACLLGLGVPVSVLELKPPPVLVVKAHIIRVRDMTLDSLSGRELGGSPTVAYALVRTHALVVVERYRENVPVLRHEALHFLLWHALKRYGHPDEVFGPCDREF